MKKRLTINRMALGSLRTRRKQYASLTVSIVLAIFFVSSMMLIGQSMNYTMHQDYLRREGSQDAILCDAEAIDSQELIDLGYAKRVGSMKVLGEADVPDCNQLLFFTVGELDEVATSMGGRPISSGRMPENASEIAIEKWALRWIRPGAQLGDQINISLKSLRGNNMFLKERISRSYTLVGILTNKERRENIDHTDAYLELPALIVNEQPTELGAKPAIHRMVELGDAASLELLNTYAESKLVNYMREDRLLKYEYSGLIAAGGATVLQIELLALVLVVAACLGIVNAFTAILTDRRTQIGMLRAVGATRKQIRQLFGRETLIIALVATPFAIGLSILVVWGLCELTGLFDFYMTMPFVVLTAVVSLLVVIAAALVPLWGASGISPMQAIRETSLMRSKRKLKLKQQMQFDVPTLLARRHISLYRNKQIGISAIVAVSLLLLSMLFIMADGILAIQVQAESEPDYKVGFDSPSSFGLDCFVGMPRLTDADRARIAKLPTVERVQGERIIFLNIVVPEVTDYLLSPFSPVANGYAYLLDPTDPRYPKGPDSRSKANYFREQYRLELEQQPQSGKLLRTELRVIDEEILSSLATYVTDGSIDIEAINRGEEVVVFAPAEVEFGMWQALDGDILVNPMLGVLKDSDNYKTEGVAKNDMFFAGEALTLYYLYGTGHRAKEYDGTLTQDFVTNVKRWDGTPRIGALVSRGYDNSITHLAQGEIFTTFAGVSAMGIPNNGYDELQVFLSKTPNDEFARAFYDQLESISQYVADTSVKDHVTEAMNSRNAALQAVACGAAVLILFFSICLSMVNNALTNRMRSEKRAIGTMRAVGASLDAIASSYFKQLMIMLGDGFAVGLVLGVMVIVLHVTAGKANLTLPIWVLMMADLVFVALVLLASMTNLRSRLKVIMKSSIVNNIREL